MAELILTESEKKAASYLDWPDADLGKLVRSIAINLKSEQESIQAASLALLLAGFVSESGAAKGVFNLTEITHKEKALGSWTITVEKNA